MKKYLLKNVGNFYKANLHVHTTVSDGDFSPEEVKQMYMDKGYSIVGRFLEIRIWFLHLMDVNSNFSRALLSPESV